MKYFKLYIFLIFLFIFSCDKEEFDSGQAETFIKYFGGDRPYDGIQVLSADDGGYIILGNIENSNRHQDICIVRTDVYGNTVEPIKVYGSFYDDYGYAIKKNNDGYIIAGSTKMTNTSDKEIFLVQIDNAGTEIWSRSFGSERDDEAFDILVLDNQDLVLTGYSKVSENNTDLMIAKTNSAGDSLWMRTQGLLDENEIGNSIVEAGSYFIIGGSRNTGSSENATQNGYLVQVTDQGRNPLLVTFDTDGASEISSVVDAGNNNFYAACTVESELRDRSKINIINFRHNTDNEIDTIWTKEYGEGIFNRTSYIRANNNSVTVVGTSGTNIASGDLLLLNIDLEGNSPEYNYTGDGNSFIGNGFDFTSDGGYIITGSNYSNGNSVITLAKLNSGGKL